MNMRAIPYCNVVAARKARRTAGARIEGDIARFGDESVCTRNPGRAATVSCSLAVVPRGQTMLLLLGAAFALNSQAQAPSQSRRRPPTVRDSVVDSATTPSGRRHRQGVRRPVTAEVLATALKDQPAKTTLLHARVARLTQDSSL